MPPSYFPLRWESTGDQWWYASPIDWAAANGHYDSVRELLYLDTNLLIKLTSLRRIRRLETVWDDEEQFNDVAKCRCQVARKLLLECETRKGQNSLIRAGYGGWLLYTAASAADVGFVKELLERDPFLVFGEAEYGVTDILYAAARSKNCEVFRLLLNSGILQRSFHGNEGEADDENDEIGALFRWEIMNRAVHAAARGGSLEILKELLQDSADVLVYRDSQGSTLLHTASGRGQVEVVKDLLASFDIITSTDNNGNTALHLAAYRGYLAVVKELIRASPSCATMTNNAGDTFVHMAIAGFRTPGFHRLDKQIELMKELVSGKIVKIEDIINVKNKDGRTALHVAVIENVQSDLVELLMTVRYIDLNIRDSNGMTPLDLLKQRPRSASSEILIKRLISAGGISNCPDQKARNVLVSQLKMQNMGSSPGTSFRISDGEIVFYTGAENSSVPNSTEFGTCCSELSRYDSSRELESKKSSSLNNATTRLQMLLRWAQKKDRKCESSNVEDDDDDSMELYKISRLMEEKPTPLRKKFAKSATLYNKRTLSLRSSNLPSPLTRKRFAASLMHGVIQAMPQFDSPAESPSSPLSASSVSSPTSINKPPVSGEIKEAAYLSHSFNGRTQKANPKQNSLNKRLMNKFFCFGAQGLNVEDSISRLGHSNRY
ncbi:Ankyrin repeat [Dillenia turbinata]|uniref:Ankyrin repeat n=1 Tax=Dillenia turbinata TaxID=194707 RepID=A0AAN8ZAM2_9MAGN